MWGFSRKKQTPSPSVSSLPSQPITPIKFKIAGAEMEATEGNFKGAFHPIPLNLWNAIIGFHRQVSINFKAESVSYHRWHAPTARYHTLIPHQETRKHGLSVNVDWRDPKNVQLLDAYGKKFGEEFLPACTIHTHVDIQAFESGTDAKDEDEAPGWHITLGNLVSRDKYDFDFRMRLPKLKSLKTIVDVNSAYKLHWENLFIAGEGTKEWLETTPGTTDFHPFLERVNAS
jgi:hypothetical protein